MPQPFGLRDYLLGIQGAQQASQQFASSAEDLRKMAAQNALRENLPQLSQQGDIGQISGLSLAGGIEKPLDVLSTAMAVNKYPKVPGTANLTADQWEQSGLTPEQAKIAEKQPDLATGLKYANTSLSGQAKATQKAAQEQQVVEGGRRQATAVEVAANKFNDKIDNTFKANKTAVDGLRNILNQDMTTPAAFQAAISTAVKVVGKDSGNIAFGEQKTYVKDNLINRVNAMAQFLTSSGKTTVDPAQVEDLKRTIQSSADYLQESTRSHAADLIRSQYAAGKPFLFEQSGNKLHPAVSEKINEYGLTANVDKKGNLKLSGYSMPSTFAKKSDQSGPKMVISGAPAAEIATAIGTLPEGPAKQSAIAAMKRITGPNGEISDPAAAAALITGINAYRTKGAGAK